MKPKMLMAVMLLTVTLAGAQALVPTGKAGAYTGFDLHVGGQTVARVRLCSNDMLTAGLLDRPADQPGTLIFRDLRFKPEAGVGLAPGSGVIVRPGPAEDPYPRLEFALVITSFDGARWKKALGGPCPFHFLTLSVDNAEAIHHRGFLVATPKLDPYPLQVGRQGVVASAWSRDWTWAPPMGACPIPVAGLWAPTDKCYAAYDFMEPRLTDHSEKLVASAYCARQGESESFIALVAPYARDYVNLAYPKCPLKVESHCRLLYDVDLPAWRDPNRWYHERLWRVYRDQLPGAPSQNDLSWLPAYARATEWPGVPASLPLTYTVPEKDPWESNFWEPGAILAAVGSATVVDVWYRRGMTAQTAWLKEQLKYFLARVKRFDVNGEHCCYWEKPLEGKPRLGYAGDPTTLRNVHGWAIANVMLAAYEHDPDPQYLEVAEGVLNWTRYNICTRNDISDVPEAMFTIGWGGTQFCLRYWRLFHSDPDKSGRAAMALDLAHNLAYRYTTLFMPDNAEDDNLDGTYLVEPNSGRPWTGQPCANECCAIPDELLRVYVETGDPILLAYVRGMVARWHLLYQQDDCESTATSETPFTEAWGLFDGCAIGGRDKRATYGAFGGFDLIKPVGDAPARVVCGSRGAVCFTQRGAKVDISDYRAGGPLSPGDAFARGLSFKVDSHLETSFELDVTVPNYDISGVGVMRLRAGKATWLTRGQDFEVPPGSLWDIVIHDVADGDVIALQAYNPQLPALDTRPVKTIDGPRDWSAQGFAMADLRGPCNLAPSLDWDDNRSYAGVPWGDRVAYGVPFYLNPPWANDGKVAVVGQDVALGTRARALAFLISDADEGAEVEVRYGDGKTETVKLEDSAVAWKAWPNWYTARILIVPYACVREEVASVSLKGGSLWAVTVAKTQSAADRIVALTHRIRSDRKLAAEEQRRAAQREKRLQTGNDLLFTVDVPKASSYCYAYVYFRKGRMTVPEGAFLQYDVMVPWDSVRDAVAVDLSGGDLGNLRDRGLAGHPAQALGERGAWVHRRYDLGSLAGKTFDYAVVATDGSAPAGRFSAYLRDIALTDAEGKVLLSLYDNSPRVPVAAPDVAPDGGLKEMVGPTVTTVSAWSLAQKAPPGALVMTDGVAKDDFSSYPPGASGLPTWRALSGTWSVQDRTLVGRDCEVAGWMPQGVSGGDLKWKDFRLSLKFRLLESGGDWRDGPWIGFRCARNQRSGYSVNFGSREVQLHKFFLGRGTADLTALTTAPWQPDNRWHSLVITVGGARMGVEVDGSPLLRCMDESALKVPPIPAGNIILCARRWAGSQGHTTVAFSDVEVRLLTPNPTF